MIAKQVIRAATGWLELGMPEDALEELAALSEQERRERGAIELTLAAQMAKADWPHAAETALSLCEIAADEPDFFMNAAYCLHEAGRTAEARKCLSMGPSALTELPTYHYNMACYLCILGEKSDAREHLAKAVEMDESFLESARADKDLMGINL